MKRHVLAVAALAMATLPSSSRAAESPPDSAPSDTHLRGLELTLRPGFGGAPGSSPLRYAPSANAGGDPGALLTGASPWGPGFVGQATLGWRPHPLLSAGLRGGFRTASASSVSDGSTALSRSSWDAGFFLRGYPLGLHEKLRRYVDPWVGVGVEYMRDTQSFDRPAATNLGTSVNATWMLDHHAVVIPIGIGLDYRLAPMLSVGPAFEYAIAVPVAGCASQSAEGFYGATLCTTSGAGKSVLAANGYGVWSAGIDFRLTLF